ncbi:MAG: site-specific integrase [Desulfobacteraceae bacterium]|nr:site-specific integrase [Desulfobacteraceae bacterium]
MPYKEGKNWRATPHYKKERLKTKLCNTKKEAQEHERAERKRAKNKERRLRKGMDLMSFCTRYLDYASRYAAKVYDEKKAVTKRILATWGADMIVAEITPELAQQYLDTQAKKRSANAANKDRKNLLAMWNIGKRFMGVESNPWGETEKCRHDREPQYTPASEDVLKVLMVATRKERVFLDAYLQTGARRSEIFRWTWVDDINFERREYRLSTRKTKDGNIQYDWFPMSQDLYESLKWQWENRTFKDSPYVFVDDQPGPHYGKPYKERRRFMAGLCKRAGVKKFGFHALRRFVASVLADSGKSTKTIQRILRHQNFATTERYLHNINNDLKNVFESLSFDQVFNTEEQNKNKNST